jgi:putative zinc finger/helix-turn-helix YgiT family protein
MECPKDHGEMIAEKREKRVTFRGKEIKYTTERFVCRTCGIEAADNKQMAEIQKQISDAYRRTVDLLTSEEIRVGRAKMGFTQEQLAKALNVGIASIKRWETGQIQSKSMDNLLRSVFSGQEISCDPYTGNKPLSLPRIKLLLECLGGILNRKMLRTGDRYLYAAKYLWYVDMLNFRTTGQGLTGATYATLPQGPQLNNYRDLVPEIHNSNEQEAEHFSEEEQMIIRRVAKRFPTNKSIYDAAHEEEIYRNKKMGALIPYTDAEHLKAI